MIRTYVLDTDMLPDPYEHPGQWEACMQNVTEERAEKIRRIRHVEAKKQSLGAGLLLHAVWNRSEPDAQITQEAYGKPVCAAIPFNLSHTKEAVILSVAKEISANEMDTPDLRIGCDIEQIHTYKPGIARRFFTKEEYHTLEAVGDPQAQAELFCRYWTKKESVMKMTGLGLALPMELYDVRGGQAITDNAKVHAWYEKELQKDLQKDRKKEQKKEALAQAACILLQEKIYLKEYRYKKCCITVCSTVERFAADLSILHSIGNW